MESDPDAIPEFTDTSEETATKRPRLKIKPLFKFRIVDLLSIPYDKSSDSFKYKSYDVNLVMCGGKITDIFRDDIIFAFESKLKHTGQFPCSVNLYFKVTILFISRFNNLLFYYLISNYSE